MQVQKLVLDVTDVTHHEAVARLDELALALADMRVRNVDIGNGTCDEDSDAFALALRCVPSSCVTLRVDTAAMSVSSWSYLDPRRLSCLRVLEATHISPSDAAVIGETFAIGGPREPLSKLKLCFSNSQYVLMDAAIAGVLTVTGLTRNLEVECDDVFSDGEEDAHERGPPKFLMASRMAAERGVNFRFKVYQ